MREPAIGIDLGTTNSLVATVERDRPEVIPNRSGVMLTPSMVGFLPSGERVVGERARELAEDSPQDVAYATKRYLGRRWTAELAAEARSTVAYPLVAGPSQEVRVKLGGRALPVAQIAAMILAELRLDAQMHFGRSVSRAVITVPANFDDAQRNATKEAGRIAGLEVLRLVNEPTAAAIAYGLPRGMAGHCLVFDLGGGTFDASVLEVQDGVFEVRSTGGDPLLGGVDFDQQIVRWFLEQLGPQGEAVARDKVSMQRLTVAAERAKRALSSGEETLLAVDGLGDGGRGQVSGGARLTRAIFERLCESLVDRALMVCGQVLAQARLQAEEVKALLLVGGMTRMPLVRRAVSDFLGVAPATGVDPDQAVALGAAIQAAELCQQRRSSLLIDVASHSIGVGIAGGRVRRLIAKNTAIPVAAKEVFVPSRHGQERIRVPIYQGEGERQQDNVKLGDLVLEGLVPGSRADCPIEISFELSQDGILAVRATDQTSGISEAARIEAHTGLGEKEQQALAAVEQGRLARRFEREQSQIARALGPLLDRGNRYIFDLQDKIAEQPSPGLEASLSALRALVDLGNAALASADLEEMAAVRRRLIQVLRVNHVARRRHRRRPASPDRQEGLDSGPTEQVKIPRGASYPAPDEAQTVIVRLED